ncbi:MAG: DUF2277 domain-containing protein [Anaerolineales bacterium]
MCRSIRVLRRVDGQPTDEELQTAALQFVRKISGYRKPSRANAAAFERAVADIAHVSRELFDQLVVRPVG